MRARELRPSPRGRIGHDGARRHGVVGPIDPQAARGVKRTATLGPVHLVGRAKGAAGAPGDSRCTPPVIWRACLGAAGLAVCWDLDPASNPHSTVPASVRWQGLSGADDGLLLPWAGDVWLNPPFSAMARWTSKALREARRARSVTLLVPGDSSTAWWRSLARASAAWAVWPRREHFPLPGEQGRGSPGGGVHLFWLGPAPALWRAEMEIAGALTFPGAGERPCAAVHGKRRGRLDRRGGRPVRSRA